MCETNYINGIHLQVLPDKCFQKHVGCAWGRGNKFTIYPRSQTVNKTPTDTADNKLLNIKQDILLFTPILRKLVNESNGTYLSLQKAAEAAKVSDNQVEFLKLSRQFRSIIRVCLENLQEAAAKAEGIEKNNLLSYITIFYSIECIWHLCEILYIDNIPGDIVLPYLLEWVRFHFPCHEQTAAQLLGACERGSEDHEDYWDTVVGMVVQGRVDVARALLKLHSAGESNEFKLVDNSLRSMPVYSVSLFPMVYSLIDKILCCILPCETNNDLNLDCRCMGVFPLGSSQYPGSTGRLSAGPSSVAGCWPHNPNWNLS